MCHGEDMIKKHRSYKNKDGERKSESGSGGWELEKVTLRNRQGCSFRQAANSAVTASTRVVLDPWREALWQME